MLDKRIIKQIEEKVGLSIDKIRSMCPEEFRKYIEKKNGKKLKIKSAPIHEYKTTEEIERENEEILKWW